MQFFVYCMWCLEVCCLTSVNLRMSTYDVDKFYSKNLECASFRTLEDKRSCVNYFVVVKASIVLLQEEGATIWRMCLSNIKKTS